jgi:ABC-2 type transport system ATP-binding protein
VSSLIRFDSLVKIEKDHKILDNLSFEILEKDIFGIIGPSGTGKTTLLKILISSIKPTSGSIYYRDKNIIEKPKLVKKLFGFASQDDWFYENLTVIENLEYFASFYKIPNRAAQFDRLLSLVELKEYWDTLASNLSGGMKRRLDLAISLLHNPEVVIMDEPTSGLDPLLRKNIWKLIKQINKEGKTIIVTSHLLEEVEHICNRIAIMNQGKVLEVGEPEQLRIDYCRNEEIILESFPGDYNGIVSDLGESKLDIAYIAIRSHKLVIYTKMSERVLHNILHILEKKGERLLDIQVDKPSLSEVFEALTKK